ncbi:MAG TPA: FlgD immunoglobulin-like domain containing protein, partial [Candidatus Eisenbacteria bacterium]|nr:FlgD immunoglobulin-like domain containing protein [Candidatus Eisenbacteria bacterium]
VAFASQPAPVGTASTHVLLGVLQGPTDPVPDVFYDHATFVPLGPPTPEQRQWLDFPGGRTIDFSGRTWRVKGPGYYDPGPSLFSDSPSHVWVDGDGRLHLTIRNVSGSWYSTEVVLAQPLGYGDYVFTTRGRLDALDPRTVLGMFLWEYGACWDPAFLWWNPFNEIDVEFSRWGDPENAVAQFVNQPFDIPGNLQRFDATFSDGEVASHAFRYLPTRVEFRSWRGGPGDESPANMIHAWTYSGLMLPRPDSQRVHINLWQFTGPPAANQEVVLDAFTFVPVCPSPPCAITAVEAAESPRPVLDAPRPNPFSSRTTIRYAAPRAGRAEIVVFDVAGRRVRTLLDAGVAPGPHEVAWDGRDESGRRVGTGVYLCRVRMDGFVRTTRLLLVR